MTWLWQNDDNSTSRSVLLDGDTGCKCGRNSKWKRLRKRVGMVGGGGGSSDGERGQHSSEASGVLVDGDELWPLVHFKSVSVKSTLENSFFFFLLQRS